MPTSNGAFSTAINTESAMNVAAHHEPTKPRPVVGLNILQILKTRDLTASELAKYLDVHRSYMSRMLNGSNPIEPYLPKISEYLSVPVDQLEREGKPLVLEETSLLPWGPLDKDGRGDVPNGCLIKRLDRHIDTPRGVGRYVMLAPTKQKPKSGELVYCALLNGDVYLRVYLPNPGDGALFMLQPNAAGGSIVAVSTAHVHELRVVALRNLFNKE